METTKVITIVSFSSPDVIYPVLVFRNKHVTDQETRNFQKQTLLLSTEDVYWRQAKLQKIKNVFGKP